jgi:hypothetical protein
VGCQGFFYGNKSGLSRSPYPNKPDPENVVGIEWLHIIPESFASQNPLRARILCEYDAGYVDWRGAGGKISAAKFWIGVIAYEIKNTGILFISSGQDLPRA